MKNKKGKQYSYHLSKSILLEETGSPMILRTILVFGTILLGVFLFWGFNARLDEVAIAQGEIVPVSQMKKVQHPEGGVVERIVVEDGQFVEKNQTLIWLDTSESQTRIEVQTVQKAALQAQKSRLQSCINDITPEFLQFDPNEKRFKEIEKRIIGHLRGFSNLQSAIFESQIRKLRGDLQTLDGQEKSLLIRKASLDNELALKRELVQKGFETKLALMTLQRDYDKVNAQLIEIPLDRRRLFVDLQNSSLVELEEVNRELEKLNKIIANHKETRQKARIKSPVDGIVHNLIVHSEKEIIPPGATIMEVVPKEKEMKAEIKISPTDIGHIDVGQNAILKFMTYDFSRYGSIDGSIISISPTTFLDKQGRPYYKGVVTMGQQYLGDNPHQNPILPGMTVEVDIRTGSKTLLEYLLKPIFASSQKALRER